MSIIVCRYGFYIHRELVRQGDMGYGDIIAIHIVGKYALKWYRVRWG